MRHPQVEPRPRPGDARGGVSAEWLATAALVVAVLAALGTGAVGERLGAALAGSWCRVTTTLGAADCQPLAAGPAGPAGPAAPVGPAGATAPDRVTAVPEVAVAHAAVGDAAATTPTPVTPDELPRDPEAPPLPDGSLADLVALLEIDDGPPPGGYDRARFPHWAGTGDGCNVREAILRRDFVGHELTQNGCRPVAGTGELRSVWDGEVVDDPSRVDVDHIRSLSEAWDAGASTWTDEERRSFANDPANLVAVTASSNRSKGSLGPDAWLPDHDQEATCFYLVAWTQVTIAYELTVTTTELDAVSEHTDVC
ncbi:HNH endonuclease [Nitriliruptoraceae bacterium ZYF776]|nr:HNH endonuclease [Profundirhabdus halotolerans]